MTGLPISAWAASWKRDHERNEQEYYFEIFQTAGFTGTVFENESSGTRYHTTRNTDVNVNEIQNKTKISIQRLVKTTGAQVQDFYASS